MPTLGPKVYNIGLALVYSEPLWYRNVDFEKRLHAHAQKPMGLGL